eukprot:Phypoly_transcript_01833.p1 GENE.Phypoly_transcript_01833~~Phypoly_transcript_01833.p1  ORF type:complete len:1007 (+),score=348.03 Phypoly_transcript_01833:65-3085(+)
MQLFHLIDKFNDSEVELEETRAMLTNLQMEHEASLEDKSAKELESKLVQLELHNATLNQRLEQALSVTNDMHEEHQKAVHMLETKLVQLEQHNATLNNRLETALTSTSVIEEEYRKTVRTLESKLVQLDLRNAELADENDALREAVHEAATRSAEVGVDALDDSVSVLKAELADRNEELELANDELRHVNAALADRAATSVVLTELRQRVAVLEGIADSAKELELRNMALAKQVEELEAILRDAARIKRENAVLAHTSDKFKQKLTDAERLEHRNAALASITDELRHRIAELESNPEIENLSQEVSVLEEEREDLREYIAKLETDCEDLRTGADEVTARNEELAQRNRELTLRLDDIAQSTEELAQRSELLAERNEHLAQQNDELTQRIEVLAERNEHLAQQNEELSSANDQLRAKLAEAQETHENFVTTTEEERAANHSSFVNLQTALNEEKDAVQALEETISDLKIELEDLKKATTTKGKDEYEEGELKQIDLELELRQAQLTCSALREQLAQTAQTSVQAAAQHAENGAVTQECARLREELAKERAARTQAPAQVPTQINDTVAQECARLREELAKEREARAQAFAQAPTQHAGNDALTQECARLREELAKERSARESAEAELAVDQGESRRLHEEIGERKQKYKKVKKEMKELKKEVDKLEKLEKRAEKDKEEPPKHSAGEYDVLKEECATLRGECRALREDRNAWREECNTAKDESKKWRDQCSAAEIECREVRIVHEEGVQLITALRRDNELMRRDNELLWEQLDAWGALGHGLGIKGDRQEKPGREDEKKVMSGGVEVSPISTHATIDSQDTQSTQRADLNGLDESQQDTQGSPHADTPGNANGLDESHHSAASAPAGRMRPVPSPIPLRPSSQPHLYPQTHADADASFETGMDTQSVMFEAQALAHQRNVSMILTQMEKLGTQLHALIHSARNTNAEQWANHQSHTAHLTAQASRMRDTTLRLRDVYDKDSQRIQEASLDALRSHLHGIKSVYNALSY